MRNNPINYSEYSLSQQFVDFAKKCLNKDPNQRSTVKQLLQHPWYVLSTVYIFIFDIYNNNKN